MTKKEIAEIKNTFTVNRLNIDRISTCYVTHDKQKLFPKTQSLLTLPEEEIFKYLDIFRKSLSGTIGKNLFTIECNKLGDKDSPVHELERLRTSALKTQEQIDAIIDKVIESYLYAENYLIVIAHGVYDIPGKLSDGSTTEDFEDVYEYLLLSICPVNLSKAALTVDYSTECVKDGTRDWVVELPSCSLLYPAFTDRSTDLNNALYYAKKADDKQEEFLAAIADGSYPLTQKEEQAWFAENISTATESNCSFDSAKNIATNLTAVAAEKAIDGEASVDKLEMERILSNCDFTEEQVEAFCENYDEVIGRGNELLINNIADTKKLTVDCGDAVVKVNMEQAQNIETKMIDGRLCLVIPLNSSDVIVNGIPAKVGTLSC